MHMLRCSIYNYFIDAAFGFLWWYVVPTPSMLSLKPSPIMGIWHENVDLKHGTIYFWSTQKIKKHGTMILVLAWPEIGTHPVTNGVSWLWFRSVWLGSQWMGALDTTYNFLGPRNCREWWTYITCMKLYMV